jgi:hypothetical protein
VWGNPWEFESPRVHFTLFPRFASQFGQSTGFGDLSRSGKKIAYQRFWTKDTDYVDPPDMLTELREDNKSLTARMREAHDV